MARDTPSAAARVVGELEARFLEEILETDYRIRRSGDTRGQFSWLEVLVRQAVVEGANYQREALPRSLREVSLDLRDPLVEQWVRSRIQRILEPYTADATSELVLRSRVTATGEANAAVFFGRHALVQQVIDRGLVRPDQVEREWRAVRDRRTRDSHAGLHAQVRPWGVPFVSPSTGIALMHPHDATAPIYEVANCRCSEVIRVSA